MMSLKAIDFSKISSLKKRADFLLLGKEGKKWVSHGMIIQMRPNGLDEIRVGYTVSKRVNKSAVVRNRIKRRLRAVIAEIMPEYARGSCDYVLIGRKDTATRSYELLRKDLKWCLRKTGYVRKAIKE